ncbi:hypothetical protein WDJ50_18450 (plasmid) [Deinococcus sp. VB142]|uniref:Uncharacterized protein n=1 Tax=Deinococcus sp. VB142 TaxID=3112952 RepID=A0AAU6Q7U8_9DEIO
MIAIRPQQPAPRPLLVIGPPPHPSARLCACTDGGRQQPQIRCTVCRGTGWVR